MLPTHTLLWTSEENSSQAAHTEENISYQIWNPKKLLAAVHQDLLKKTDQNGRP